MTDYELVSQAEKLYSEDALSAAYLLLQKVVDKTILKPEHEKILEMGKIMEKSREEMLSLPEESGWKKQSESHGDLDYLVYYKILPNGAVRCRIDSPVESSLFVPFLAVLNEPDLYSSWVPSWKFPFRVGVLRSLKLFEKGRYNQVIHIVSEIPFPFQNREVVLWRFDDDDSERNRIHSIKFTSLQTNRDHHAVPPVHRDTVRMDVEGG